jgi:hypothetical protein
MLVAVAEVTSLLVQRLFQMVLAVLVVAVMPQQQTKLLVVMELLI